MKPSTVTYMQARGPYTDLHQLTSLHHVGGGHSLPMPVHTSSPLSGTLSSRFRGRGMDLAEVRSYQPGDDVRAIDWRVTARTGKPHTKVFQEERERPVLLLVDQSSSLFFGSRRAFKSVVAAEVAVMLAWAALRGGDRVGGLVFNESLHGEIRPRRSHHQVLRLINRLHEFNHRLNRAAVHQAMAEGREGAGLEAALKKCSRVARHGTMVFIVSDFAGEQWKQGGYLQRLALHNDVFAIWITDLMEEELPPPDEYLVARGSEQTILDTTVRRSRQAYSEEFERQREELHSFFTHIRASFIQTRTDQPSSEVLKFFRSTNA